MTDLKNLNNPMSLVCNSGNCITGLHVGLFLFLLQITNQFKTTSLHALRIEVRETIVCIYRNKTKQEPESNTAIIILFLNN